MVDRDLNVSHWHTPDGAPTALAALPFIEEELCPPDSFDDMEPDEQHFHEATGNEGASLERSYRRAALVLWPRARKLAVLNQVRIPRKVATRSTANWPPSPRQTGPLIPRHGGQSERSDAGV